VNRSLDRRTVTGGSRSPDPANVGFQREIDDRFQNQRTAAAGRKRTT
jgi:hypothetical protein